MERKGGEKWEVEEWNKSDDEWIQRWMTEKSGRESGKNGDMTNSGRVCGEETEGWRTCVKEEKWNQTGEVE